MSETNAMEELAQIGDWVQVELTILEPPSRAPKLPSDTQQVPFQARVKGTLVERSGRLGDQVSVETASGRLVHGKLISAHPIFTLDFGHCVTQELQIAGRNAKRLLEEGEA